MYSSRSARATPGSPAELDHEDQQAHSASERHPTGGTLRSRPALLLLALLDAGDGLGFVPSGPARFRLVTRRYHGQPASCNFQDPASAGTALFIAQENLISVPGTTGWLCWRRSSLRACRRGRSGFRCRRFRGNARRREGRRAGSICASTRRLNMSLRSRSGVVARAQGGEVREGASEQGPDVRQMACTCLAGRRNPCAESTCSEPQS